MQLLGCDTGVDIVRRLGEVTNAYVTVLNIGNADASDLRVTLSGSDEDKEHPDKTQEMPFLAAGHQVTLKLTIDSDRGDDTTITVEATCEEGVTASVQKLGCQEMDPKALDRISDIISVVLPF